MEGDELEGEELASAAKKKVKFLCSRGGKILPRPADGHLKYVGGETRVVAVCRDITFSELKERLSELFDGEMVIKYQLISEDLDMLVSVKTDEDLKHMLHEYDRMHHSADSSLSPKLRTFLFPSTSAPASDDHDVSSPRSSASAFFAPSSLEQRYIDAINGNSGGGSSIRASSSAAAAIAGLGSRNIAPIVTNVPGPLTTLSISSACSSPNSNSPDQLHAAEMMTLMTSSTSMLHKVQSSPSLYRPNSPQHSCCSSSTTTHRLPPPPQQQHHCHHLCRPLPSERLGRPLSFGRNEFRTITSTTRAPLAHGIDHYYTSGYNNINNNGVSTNRQHHRGLGYINNNDDHLISPSAAAAAYIGCNRAVNRADSLPRSPIKRLWD